MKKSPSKSRICISLFLCLPNLFIPANAAKQFSDRSQDLFKMDLQELMNIKVFSPARKSERLRESPANILVIDAQAIRKLGAKMLSEVLWTVAGIQVQVKNNNRHTAWMRGVQTEFNNKIALFMDGVPFRDSHGGFKLDEEIPLENIKRIEIIRGPGSALYGANAFSGVISIFTYAAGERENNSQVKAETGNHGSWTGYLRLQGKLPFAWLQAQAKYFDTDGQTLEYDRTGVRDNTEPAAQALEYVKLKAASKDHKLKANALFSRFDNRRVSKGIEVASDRAFDRYLLNLEYDHAFSKTLEAHWNVYHTRYERFEREASFEMLDGRRNRVIADDSYNDDVSLLGLHNVFTWQLNERNTIVSGFEIQREKLEESKRTNELAGVQGSYVVNPAYKNLALTNYGFFVQDSYALRPKKTSLTLSMRYDMLDLFPEQFSYRLGIVHLFSKSISAKLLYGTAFRSPSFLEFSRAGTGTPLPDVESLKTLEAQLSYTRKEFTHTLSAYRNQYNDVIQRIRDEYFDNAGNQTIYGLEWESRFNLSKRWSGFFNLAWLRGKESGEHIPLLADWTIAAGLDWTYRQGGSEWSVHNHVTAYGDRHDWPDSTWNPGQQQRYPTRDDDLADGFIIWNAGLHYKRLSGRLKGFEASFTVNNMLDETYYTQSSQAAPKPNRAAYFDNQYDQRQYYLTLRYNWKDL
ncbi:MAG: TonB-dependent receptor plug domain-containing protein [Gammaproteobacteria bacterium]|nr:TonB-dependent receptor plug domain-containing protein [Gammaproteobacteria bacterium]